MKDSIGSGNAERMQALTTAWTAAFPAGSEHGRNGQTDAWVASKVDEIQVLNSFLACATGRLGKETRIDFFLVRSCETDYVCQAS